MWRCHRFLRTDSTDRPTAAAPPPVAQAPVLRPGGRLFPVSLSGVVFESTSTGRAPVEGVEVYCDACGPQGHSWAYTDKDGLYGFSGDVTQGGGVFLAADSTTVLIVSKDGYAVVDPAGTFADGWGRKIVTFNGDTTFDIELVRR